MFPSTQISCTVPRVSGAASLLFGALALLGTALLSASNPRTTALSDAERARILDQYGKLPLSFIPNQGQADPSIAWYAHTPSYSLYFTREGHALRLSGGRGGAAKAHTIKVELVDADAKRVEGQQRAEAVVSYFKGAPDDWRTGIATHGGIAYIQAWPGIDLTYNGKGGSLESVYIVAPHADPTRIKLRYSGQESLRLDQDGNLVYGTSLGDVKESAPILYQDIDGRRVPVQGSYRLLDHDSVSFQVAAYDKDHALVIDPTLVYAGYIGGTASNDLGLSIAVDSAGHAYIAGRTDSAQTSFPVIAGPDLTYNFGTDAFVAKVSISGDALLYAGYIGGNANDIALGVAVDSAGHAYVTGRASSAEATFPVFGGPDASFNGVIDAFIAKVNPNGTGLIFSGYIGGNAADEGNSITLDSAGNAYITGYTASTAMTFPVLAGPDASYNGGVSDAFVAKVSANGTLLYAGYIGGLGEDLGLGIAVDAAGNAYATGFTLSNEGTFPVQVGPDLTHNGARDAFIARVNASGTALDYCGYIGGSGDDRGFSVAVDSGGSAYVVGMTSSTQVSFPVLIGPDLTHNGGQFDGFISKVSPSGATLAYSGYIGGINDDRAQGVVTDNAGNAYVAGRTASDQTTFPVVDGPDLTHNGSYDVFITKVNGSGNDLIFSTYVGGEGVDQGFAIARDSAGNLYVTGDTDSPQTTFPVLVGPDLTIAANNSTEAFVLKLSESTGALFRNGFE